MENIIFKNEYYSIRQGDRDCLYELSEFVVKENYRHHSKLPSNSVMQKEIEYIYNEESTFLNSSNIFIVRNLVGSIIGSIRVFKWDKIVDLPLQKIFGIDLLHTKKIQIESNIWHIGRFAISSKPDVSQITLFKRLMIYAIHPIISDRKSYMIAETDVKLLKVLKMLGIKTIQLGSPVNYLGSETIPIYSDKDGLISFYNKNKNSLNNKL